MFACSRVSYCTMRSMTGRGIWLDAALSRKTSGFPFTSRSRIGKSARTRWTSSAPLRLSAAVWIAVIECSSGGGAGLRHHRAFEPLHHRAHGNALDHGGAERIGEEVARRAVGKPAAAKIEQLFGIELSHGGAVRALHVVREDLELRLGVHRRLVGEQQIAALLGRIGELRAGTH